MGTPKLLNVFDKNATPTAYSKLSNYVNVEKSGEYIIVNSCTVVQDGAILVFNAPTSSSSVKGIKIGTVKYLFRDANDKDIKDLSNLFSLGALVSVRLDCTKYAAYIQNADTNLYLEDKLTALENRITYGKTDLAVGTDTLATGNIYLMYV